MYPCMHCADIFLLKIWERDASGLSMQYYGSPGVMSFVLPGAISLFHFPFQADICQLGLDQRKVNMLAREYCDQTKRKFKPVILSHRMMPGLLEVSCGEGYDWEGRGWWGGG